MIYVPISIYQAGGQPREHSWLPNEEGYATTDMESDQLHVPAPFLFSNCHLLVNSIRLSLEPARRSVLHFVSAQLPQSVSSMILSRQTELHQNKLILRART